MDIIFSTREYERTYGHKPRGRGWWWFRFEGFEFQATGTYTEAKNACKKHIHEIAPHGYRGIVTVNVET